MTSGATIIERAVYRGPHLYGPRPMIRIQVDLAALEGWPSDRIPGFNQALLQAIPTLAQHGCSYREPGGFVRRLEAGTWFGHVVEHVALELQTLAGGRATRGKTRSVKRRPGVYNVLFDYVDEATGLLAGRLAFEICDSLLPADLRGIAGLDMIAPPLGSEPMSVVSVDAAVALLSQSRRKAALGPTTQALVEAARRRRIPIARLNGQSLVQLGWGSRQRRLRASVTDRTGLVASELAGDKAQAKAMLQEVGCPVAKGVVVATAEEALTASQRLSRPLVAKPLDGNHGRGVTTGLMTDEAILVAFGLAGVHSRRVIIEEELPGRDHRILVVDGRVVAVAERVPAQVVGDGSTTVLDLVEAVNRDPRRGSGHENSLTRIRLDDQAAQDILERQGLTIDSVPAKGRVVALRTTANLSSGGTAIDLRTRSIRTTPLSLGAPP